MSHINYHISCYIKLEKNKLNMYNNFFSPELTKLWNLCPNNLEACKSKERDFLPSLETYFEEAVMQLDPAAMVDNEYK